MEVTPMISYITLVVPDELITMTGQYLTAVQTQNLCLALRPDASRVQLFAQHVYRQQHSMALMLQLVVPGSMHLIVTRHIVAPSSHEQIRTAASAVFYDLNIMVETLQSSLRLCE